MPSTIVMECGHDGLCVECAGRLWRQPPNMKVCPLCRQSISGIVRIVGAQRELVKVEPLFHPTNNNGTTGLAMSVRGIRSRFLIRARSDLSRNYSTSDGSVFVQLDIEMAPSNRTGILQSQSSSLPSVPTL
mmetsp:Transcript_17750/g.49136  ORF Transcript_17750/g.49136 Transcript_17750/m.49136 type:complete len:131 (-) Transcript_17750:543-935(-)|eukprot:CAMPEP_0113664572 /NCGR_PEP_ID=MMETSP0038_2-20120614/1812_1 /TAXON_ID=2898 /ORGANISM="Cryptomonas paramecium" /LENGTH=130 /DNA_ID=CAMNT_0000579805 /DNA_START=448 /DNA_END=840 /DNA_ORIENTATION=+ /assembly_acc=CAM_ASM_000170